MTAQVLQPLLWLLQRPCVPAGCVQLRLGATLALALQPRMNPAARQLHPLALRITVPLLGRYGSTMCVSGTAVQSVSEGMCGMRAKGQECKGER